jgi:hypothetical protein
LFVLIESSRPYFTIFGVRIVTITLSSLLELTIVALTPCARNRGQAARQVTRAGKHRIEFRDIRHLDRASEHGGRCQSLREKKFDTVGARSGGHAGNPDRVVTLPPADTIERISVTR